jgi:hypothetical protein
MKTNKDIRDGRDVNVNLNVRTECLRKEARQYEPKSESGELVC